MTAFSGQLELSTRIYSYRTNTKIPIVCRFGKQTEKLRKPYTFSFRGLRRFAEARNPSFGLFGEANSIQANDRSKITGGFGTEVVAQGDSTVTASGNAKIKAKGRSTIDASDRCRIEATEQAHVTASGRSKVIAADKSEVIATDQVTVDGSGQCKIFASMESSIRIAGKGQAVLRDFARAEAFGESSVVARDDCTVKRFGRSTIKAMDDVKVFSKYHSARIRFEDNAQLITADPLQSSWSEGTE